LPAQQYISYFNWYKISQMQSAF